MRLTIGVFEVFALQDASGTFFDTFEAAFPGAAPDDRAAAERFDPAAFGPDGAWRLDFRVFAVRRPNGRVTIVDCGTGPAGHPVWSWAPVPGRLPDELAASGIALSDVETVVLTHLHSDHIGWAVTADGAPYFPGARYVVQRSEIAALAPDSPALRHVVEPLRHNGQLDAVAGKAALSDSRLAVVPTPGHTVGHQSVLVEDGHSALILTGDVLVHAVQLVNPDVGYAHEDDQELARATRLDLLEQTRRRGAVLGTPHLRQPFTRPFGEGV
jgi:glyoxylase-like metal-dependent hydrolase (beta-lactamase superfamily II)